MRYWSSVLAGMAVVLSTPETGLLDSTVGFCVAMSIYCGLTFLKREAK